MLGKLPGGGTELGLGTTAGTIPGGIPNYIGFEYCCWVRFGITLIVVVGFGAPPYED